MNKETAVTEDAPKLVFSAPYSTFDLNGQPKRIPYVIDGLFTEGGFSLLAAKPKTGKSSIARYAAVCVSKGIPFLGRNTERGEVILVSLEDPRNHLDNCLNAMGWDPAVDSPIHITDEIPKNLSDIIAALRSALERLPNVRLVVVDTLPKFLRVRDLSEYMEVMTAIEQLRNLARSFPYLHISAITHAKKVQTDDPFDQLLGSTALRGEPDTTICIYRERGHRVIISETRIGRALPATILDAELVEVAGADVVKSFTLGASMEEWASEQAAKVDKKKAVTYEDRVIAALEAADNGSLSRKELLDVNGKTERIVEAIDNLLDKGVLTEIGVKGSRTNPSTLTLNQERLKVYEFTAKFGGDQA